MTTPLVTLRDIEAARAVIAGHVTRTPVVPSPSLSQHCGGDVHLKLESLQPTGAFKLRGATNRLMALTAEERRRGVVTMSTGNHGRGVAYAAKRLGVPAVVCMSTLVPRTKVDAIRDLGADARIVGDSQDEAGVEAERCVAEDGMVMVSPFDDPAVIAGQGTIGLELLEDLPAVDLVLVPLSGGGLIGGIAVAVKALRPQARVVGVTMERGAAMYESLKAGHPVPVKEEPTLADSLGGGIGLDNRYTFALCRTLLDDVVLVSEEEIAEAMRHTFWQDRLVAEGGAVVGQAALLTGKVAAAGQTVACILSGRNVDMHQFVDIVTRPASGGAPS